MHQYKQLTVWQDAIALSTTCYRISCQFPSDERFGLVSQIRRAAVSVASNIAEGSGRNTDGGFIQFLGIAVGSLCELDTQLLIASELNYLSQNEYQTVAEQIQQIQNKLYKLITALRNKKTALTT
ncbi:MAG: four helix bundle protein [Sphingobacteriales bacterium]|nr:MAG: four helix bundle protein [Sphingobacteriales bacterium]